MDAVHTIREAVARVTTLRALTAANPALQDAITAVKGFQAHRFAGTYWDLLISVEFAGAARFFLDELYSDKDYSQRDAQFARIAGGLQRFFPDQVVATAVSLAQLHVLTEELDHEMAVAWITDDTDPSSPCNASLRYLRAWRRVARREDRNRQLDEVLSVGYELNRLTHTRGLRLMLKLMRRPAMAAGVGALQSFLEAGFDTFAEMAAKGERANAFLSMIRSRESQWINMLFDGDETACVANLNDCLKKSASGDAASASGAS
jgi:hypothetical protein